MALRPIDLRTDAHLGPQPLDPIFVIALVMLSAIMATGVLFAVLITVAAPT